MDNEIIGYWSTIVRSYVQLSDIFYSSHFSTSYSRASKKMYLLVKMKTMVVDNYVVVDFVTDASTKNP